MSRPARTVPLIVPVTLERPIRGRYLTGCSAIRHCARDAFSTISNGQPNPRSYRPRSSSFFPFERSHRSQFGHGQMSPPSNLRREDAVGQLCVPRPGPGLNDRRAQHQVDPAVEDRLAEGSRSPGYWLASPSMKAITGDVDASRPA
jgi:hypothetical protein